MDFESAKGIMAQHRANVEGKKGIMAQLDPDKKTIGNSTCLCKYNADAVHQEHYGLILFHNLIIDFYEDFLEINDHGWFGHTTHARLNEYMPRGFSVWGTKYNYVSKPRPLGFVRTPIGVYAYSMPMQFKYNGEPNEPMTSRADEIITTLPKIVDRCLNALLGGTPMDDVIVFQSGTGDLARLAVEFSNLQHMGLTLQEIVDVLERAGAAAFARTNRPQHMENLLIHGKLLPVIHKSWLRKTLRPLMHDLVIESMGFDDVSWNRRDQ